jgi:hypothetical protein
MKTKSLYPQPQYTSNLLKLWEAHLLPNALPAVAGIGLGAVIGLLIAQGLWPLALGVVAGVPMAILLNRYPLWAFFLWLAAMPFLPFGTVPPPVFWVIHRALMPMALGLLTLERLLHIKEHKPVRLGWPEMSMVIYLAVSVVSIIITRKAPLLHLYEVYDRMFVPFVAYWLMRLVVPGQKDFKRLLSLLVVICIAEIGTGFWVRYAPQTLPTIWQIDRMDPTRMSGTFTNPTPYAYTLSVCMVLIFHAAMHHPKRLWRAILLTVFGLGLLCIFLTFTRGCWGAAVLMLLGLLALYPKPVLTLLCVVISIFVILSTSVFADEVAFAMVRLGTQDTVDSRVVLAHAGQQMFYTKPIFGWGFGNYDRYDWQFMERVKGIAPTSWDIQYGTSHNTYLTILAEMGLVGFFFQFFPVFWWGVWSIKVLPLLPRAGFWSWRLLVVLWLPVIFYLVASQIVDMRFFWFQIGTWWASLGLIGSLVQKTLTAAADDVSADAQNRWNGGG